MSAACPVDLCHFPTAGCKGLQISLKNGFCPKIETGQAEP